MKFKKFIALGLGLVTAVSALTACSGGASGSKDTKEGDISGEIRYAFWDKGQAPYFEKCVAEFNKLYPNVKVTLENSGWEEYWKKLEAGATGGSSADVFWLNGPNITKYAKGDVLLPIDDKIKEAGIDLSNYPEALLKLYNVDGVQYAIPKDFDTIGIWYNKKLFDAAGVPYPKDDWTWDDYVATAKQLTKEDKSVYGTAVQYRDQTGIYNTIFASGGYVISDDKKSSGYNKAETQAGVQLLIDLQKEGVTPSQASLEETEDYVQFLSGKIAMLMNGSWFLNQIVGSEVQDDIDVVALPSINGKKATVIHGLGNCIAKSTKNPEAAWKWVEFLASEQANKLSAETGAAIPAYKGTSKDWVEKNPKYNLSMFIKAAEEYSYPYPVSLNTGEWTQYQADNLKKAFNLEVGVKEACDKLAEEMNVVLKNEK